MMKTNEEVQKDVEEAINWEPTLHSAAIGATALNGVITLTGVVNNYAKKLGAERAAKSVTGVKAVIEKIEVDISCDLPDGDAGLASDVIMAIRKDWAIPADKVRVVVEKGWVTLEGVMPWNYQKDAAEYAIHELFGVKGITNNIHIHASEKEVVDIEQIKSAFKRNSLLSDRKIGVECAGTKITLTGTVDSHFQSEEAARIAWNSPGIWDVDNQLVIEYTGFLV